MPQGDPAQRPARVVVTRPLREAQAWVDGLHAAGLQAVALPLITIGPAPDPQALQRAWQALPGLAAVMFVSANAARGFLADHPGPWPAPVRAWATGPGTRSALEASGVPAEVIDTPAADAAQLDSEALWAVVRPQVRPGGRVLIVRGAQADGQIAGRDWLAEQLQAAGMEVDQVAGYSRRPPAWSPDTLAQVEDGFRQRAWWLFSSSEAVAHLAQAPCAVPWATGRALCTHPRIAEAARAAGFGEVEEGRPSLQDVIAFLQLHP